MAKTWISNYKWRKQFKTKPILVITFDDARATDYDVMSDARGIRCTSYINTDRVGDDTYLTWNQIKDMVKLGWDAQCHTKTHVNLTTLTEQQIRGEMEGVNAAFAANGLAEPIHHANPFGATNATVRSILAEYRETQRAGLGGPYDFDEIDFEQIGTIAMDMQNAGQLATVKLAIQNTFMQNKILIGYLHRIEDEPSGTASVCAKEYFWSMVGFALDLGIDIWTVDSMYNYVTYVNSLTE